LKAGIGYTIPVLNETEREMSLDSYEYIDKTFNLISDASKKSFGNENHSYMLGYFQSHMKLILNSLEITLTPEQKSILLMEQDALARQIGYKNV
jgi:hypothetical protein